MSEFFKLQPTLDLISFRRMVTPLIIQIIFWIGVVVVLIYGFSTIGEGVNGGPAGRAMSLMQSTFGTPPADASSGPHADAGEIFMGLLIVLLGPVAWRIYCELMIVIFSIHKELVDIRKNMSPEAKTP